MHLVFVYLALVVLSPLGLLVNRVVATPAQLLLFWMPRLRRIRVAAVLGGAGGVIAVPLLGRALFRWLTDAAPFSLLPLAASCAVLFPAVAADLREMRRLRAVDPLFEREGSSPERATGLVIGELTGLAAIAIFALTIV